ncbi:MAG: hypothetical protein KAS93_01075 [Gammaproteobacteria bacterium]|nr:hypothetical protein [Gammaproteobacteria bacterium]
MKDKYPYTGVVPSSVAKDERLQSPWMKSLKIEMLGVSSYARHHENKIFICPAAFIYIDSAFSLVPVLYDHYESLPDVYFTYLMESKETLFNNPPEMLGDVEKRIECLNKMFLILQLAIENDHPNKAKLTDDAKKIRNEINLNIYGAVKMRDKTYLSKICRKHGLHIRNDIVGNKFISLADEYQKEDLDEHPKHHAKKKSLKEELTYRQRHHLSSLTHFKPGPNSSANTKTPLLENGSIQHSST